MDQNDAQLELIRELFAECESRNLRIWLLGGWGIDALLGRISREHEDIDIIAEASSKEALHEAIEHIGCLVIDKPTSLWCKKDEVSVDVGLISYAADGTPISDLKEEDPNVYPWPPGSFPEERNGRLPGLSCRAMSWEAQYIAKAGYKDAFPGTDLRAKDDLDLETIRRHIPPEKRRELEKRWFAGIPRAKSEIRNPKFETDPNDRKLKTQNA